MHVRRCSLRVFKPPGTHEALQQLFDVNVDDKRMILDLILDPAKAPSWKPLLASLTAEEYAKYVSEVSLSFDQPEVAYILATQLANGLTMDYTVAVIRKIDEQYRANTVRKLAPKIIDLEAGRSRLEAELSDWHKILCNSAIDKAIKDRLV